MYILNSNHLSLPSMITDTQYSNTAGDIQKFYDKLLDESRSETASVYHNGAVSDIPIMPPLITSIETFQGFNGGDFGGGGSSGSW